MDGVGNGKGGREGEGRGGKGRGSYLNGRPRWWTNEQAGSAESYL